MKIRVPPLVLCLALSALFTVYAHSGQRLQGPSDKAVQLAFLGTASVMLALALRRWSAPERAAVMLLSRGSDGTFLALVLALSTGFTVWMAYGPLEGIPKGGDEAAYLVQSRMYARGAAWAPVPDVENPRDLFPFRHFIFHRDRWFVMYTPMHSLLMAPFTGAGVSPLMGPLQGALTLTGAFLLFSRLCRRATARLALLVMAVSPFFLFMASTHMAHNTELLLMTWSLYLLVRAAGERKRRMYIAGGFLLGAAFCAKPYTVVPWVLCISGVAAVKLRRDALPALMLTGLGALPALAFFLASNALYTGDPFSPAYNLARGAPFWASARKRMVSRVRRPGSHSPEGLMNLSKQAGAGSTILLGWPFLSLVPALLPLLDREKRRRWWPLYLPALATIPFMFVTNAAAVDYGPRHYYTTLPAFALCSALGSPKPGEVGQFRGSGFGALFLFSTLAVYIPDGVVLRRGPWQSIDGIPLRLARSEARAPAVVFMEASEHGYPNVMSGFLANDPFLDGDLVFCAHQTPEEDMEAMESLFQGMNAYLFHMEGNRGVLQPWTPEAARMLVPERSLRPSWAPENTLQEQVRTAAP
jgi:hypothetical protein